MHKPTGIQVRSHKTRYLEINKRDARTLLKDALDQLINGSTSKSAIADMRQHERKRVEARKSKRKHNNKPTDNKPADNKSTDESAEKVKADQSNKPS